MRHIKQVDSRKHTVIMLQVENEMGMSLDSRDFSPVANRAFAGPVPKELMDYLQQHKDTLVPEFRQVWATNGFKTAGTWEEVFGQNAATDEIFMAWNCARYAGRVAAAGKAEYRCRCTSTRRCSDPPPSPPPPGSRANPRERRGFSPGAAHGRPAGCLESRGAGH